MARVSDIFIVSVLLQVASVVSLNRRVTIDEKMEKVWILITSYLMTHTYLNTAL